MRNFYYSYIPTCETSTSYVGEPRCGHAWHRRYMHHRHARNKNRMSNFDCKIAGVINGLHWKFLHQNRLRLLESQSSFRPHVIWLRLSVTIRPTTNSNALSPPSAANSSKGSQETPALQWTPNLITSFTTAGQLSASRTGRIQSTNFPSHLRSISISYFSSIPRSSKWDVSFRSPHQYPIPHKC
jgi:hypothetical protein